MSDKRVFFFASFTVHNISLTHVSMFQVYKEATTHLIIQKALASEKFIAACAGGL